MNTKKKIVACLRMMKRHMVGTGGLTVEESERKMQEAETDEEIEEQVIYLEKKHKKEEQKQTKNKRKIGPRLMRRSRSR